MTRRHGRWPSRSAMVSRIILVAITMFLAVYAVVFLVGAVMFQGHTTAA